MAVRKILTLEQPVLRAKAKKVSRFDPYIEKLVHDMFETMRQAPGVGLAAPQIGESIRVLVAEYEDESVALVNPEIIKRSEEEELGTEGCLSIPGFVGDDVPRATAITVKARDPRGKEIRVKAEGWFARILQHEIDHLDGILYIDRIPKDKVREVREDEEVVEGEALEDGRVEKHGRSGNGGAKAEKAAGSGKGASNGASRRAPSGAKQAEPAAASAGGDK